MVVAMLFYLGLNLISLDIHNMSPFQIMILYFEPIDYEVPEGSRLGSVCLIFYINHLPVHLDKTHICIGLYQSSNK